MKDIIKQITDDPNVSADYKKNFKGGKMSGKKIKPRHLIYQKLFETVADITGHNCLESELEDITEAVIEDIEGEALAEMKKRRNK